jgi:hypothetical protein
MNECRRCRKLIAALNLTTETLGSQNTTVLAATNAAFNRTLELGRELGLNVDLSQGIIDPLALPLMTYMVGTIGVELN